MSSAPTVAKASTSPFPQPPLTSLPGSCEGYLQLLGGDQPMAVRVNALGRLLPLVDYFWHEMASQQHLIKGLLAEEGPVAALLLSKVAACLYNACVD